MIRAHIENHPIDELEPEISQVEGCPGKQTGGISLGNLAAALLVGGECFAPSGLYAQLGAFILADERGAKHSLHSRAFGNSIWHLALGTWHLTFGN